MPPNATSTVVVRSPYRVQDWLDVSGDGEVSVEEVLVALSSLNSDATREDAEELVRNATGGTGKDRNIGWLDFCAIIENGITQNATAAQMFELLDTDGIGQLSPEVLRAALTKYGCDASDAAIDKMIRYIDANNDGQVSLQEFADALARKPGEVQEGERRVQSRP